jgi:probable F420-dependent oxidoreductase
MKFGIACMFTDESISPADLAVAAEDRSFDSLFVGEHSHVPASRETPFPFGGDLPREFYRELDSFSSLSVAAAVTTSITLGTGVTLLAQRDVIYTAKEVATLDLLSGGRLVFGVGVGWMIENTRNHGIDPVTRGKRLDESLKAIKEIWANDQAEFHGQYIDFDPIFAWPKPVQKPNPPIYVGGEGVPALRRLNALGDVWMPNAARDVAGARAQVNLLRQHASTKPMTAYAAIPDNLQVIEEYVKQGIDQIVFWTPSLPRDPALTTLDDLMETATKFR